MRVRLSAGLVGLFGVSSLAIGLTASQAIPPPPVPPGAVQAGQPPAPDGTGAISGVVTDADTGKVLAGAVVSLFSQVGATRLILRQTTDEKGRFFFPKLRPSNLYWFSASRIGYVDSPGDVRISLAEGQWYQDVKIALPRLGSIGGTVSDEGGEPMVGVYVRVMVQVLVSGRPQLAAGSVARTDDRGVFHIGGLQPAKYVVNVPSVLWSIPADTPDAVLSGLTPQTIAQMEAAGRPAPPRNDQMLSPDGKNSVLLGGFPTPPPASGSRTLVYPMTFHPAARSMAEATVIDLKRGENRSNVDVQVRLVSAVRVSGVVDAPAGAQGGSMTLRLLPSGLETMGTGSEAATVLTRADGSFTFLNVPAGDYTLIASRSMMEYSFGSNQSTVSLPTPPAPSFGGGGGGGGTISAATAGTSYNFRSGQNGLAFSGRVHLSVASTDVTNVVVPLKRGVTLSGHIVYEEGTKAPTAPASITTSPVYAEPAFGDAALGMPSGAVTMSGDYPFSIEGLLPGQYVLRFLRIASTGGPKSIIWEGKDYVDRPLDASDGRDITGVVVTVTDKVGKLNGIVRDGHGQTLSHGAVILFPSDRSQWSGYGFRPARLVSTTLTTTGGYTYPRLMAGDYLAIAVDDFLAAAWVDPKFLEAAAGLASHVTITGEESKALDLTSQQVPGFGRGGL